MKNANNPIHPLHPNHDRKYNDWEGLTKREYFAAMAMKGLLSRPSDMGELGTFESNRIAEESVIMADKLLSQLEK